MERHDRRCRACKEGPFVALTRLRLEIAARLLERIISSSWAIDSPYSCEVLGEAFKVLAKAVDEAVGNQVDPYFSEHFHLWATHHRELLASRKAVAVTVPAKATGASRVGAVARAVARPRRTVRGVPLSPALRASAVPTPGNRFGLTGRELEVLALVAGGHRNSEIAEVLMISHRTVERHLDNIFAKMGVDTRTEAVVKAVQEGLIEPADEC